MEIYSQFLIDRSATRLLKMNNVFCYLFSTLPSRKKTNNSFDSSLVFERLPTFSFCDSQMVIRNTHKTTVALSRYWFH